MINNYVEHFNREMNVLKNQEDELVIYPFIPAIEYFLQIMNEEGHSGHSAPYAIKAIMSALENTMQFKPLSPITGVDSEWDDVSAYSGDNSLQNKRLSSLFKYPDGKIKYLDAIVWDGGLGGFTGTVEGIRSMQEVILPFTPKTFYIKVEEVDGEYCIVNKDDLKEVKEYYKTNL